VTDASSGADYPSGRTPSLVISAMTFALLGFACGVPAVVGLILGLIARPQAKQAGAGLGLATAAIAISIAWLVAFGVLIAMAVSGTRA
jgi:hypothetical protein